MDLETERRRRPRFPTPRLSGLINGCQLVVRNLSMNGVCFETVEPVQPTATYQVRLLSSVGPLKATGRIVWCHVAATVSNADGDVVPLYRAGMRFQPLEVRDAECLFRLLDQLAEESSEQTPAALHIGLSF